MTYCAILRILHVVNILVIFLKLYWTWRVLEIAKQSTQSRVELLSV